MIETWFVIILFLINIGLMACLNEDFKDNQKMLRKIKKILDKYDQNSD